MTTDFDAFLFAELSKDVKIPETTNERLKKVYDIIEKMPDERLYIRKNSSRRLIILAAAVITAILFAGSALAYGLAHSDFFKGVFGTGISGNENDRSYYSAEEEKSEYPLNERIEVDEYYAELQLGGYISTIGQTVTIGDSSLTINDCLIDENGIGY